MEIHGFPSRKVIFEGSPLLAKWTGKHVVSGAQPRLDAAGQWCGHFFQTCAPCAPRTDSVYGVKEGCGMLLQKCPLRCPRPRWKTELTPTGRPHGDYVDPREILVFYWNPRISTYNGDCRGVHPFSKMDGKARGFWCAATSRRVERQRIMRQRVCSELTGASKHFRSVRSRTKYHSEID